MPNSEANASARRSRSELWISRAAASGDGPIFLRIAEAIAGAVEAGELGPGDRLPPQRRVAAALGVDLTTVTRAYAHARTLGVLDGEVGRGTFVRGAASPSGPLIDLSMNLPPSPPDAPWRELVARGVAAAFRDADPALMLTYRGEMGSRRDRSAAAEWLRPLLPDLEPACVFLAPGAQSALAGLLPMLARAGDAVLAEPWTYPGFLTLARLHGVKVAALACDEEGPLLDPLDMQCTRLRPKALYLNPTLQNPTTRTISEARRAGVVALARKHSVMILEDDAYGLLPPPIAPLAAYDAAQTIYLATLAKCLTPGLRTAFVAAPRALRTRVHEALRASCQMQAPVLSDIAVRWIESGTAHSVLDAIRAESAARMQLARRLLPARAEGSPHGFHLWMALPSGWEKRAYLNAARARGVVLVSSQDFAVSEEKAPHVRISLGAPATREDLARGLRALAELES